MQPQFILATLLAGFTAAQDEENPTHFCPKGQGKLQTGPLCNGNNNQTLGPAQTGPVCIGEDNQTLGPAQKCPDFSAAMYLIAYLSEMGCMAARVLQHILKSFLFTFGNVA
ncbi:hypothetical protein NHJ6243_006506 [Beauveria neobassiana]